MQRPSKSQAAFSKKGVKVLKVALSLLPFSCHSSTVKIWQPTSTTSPPQPWTPCHLQLNPSIRGPLHEAKVHSCSHHHHHQCLCSRWGGVLLQTGSSHSVWLRPMVIYFLLGSKLQSLFSVHNTLIFSSLYLISLSWLKYIQNVAIGNKYISQILYYFAVAVLYLNISIYCCFILLLTFSGQTFNFLLHYLYLKTLVSIVTLQITFLESNKSFN